MRVWLLLGPVLLAGCAQPAPPPAQGAAPLPPSLLVDRSPAGTLHLFVHAKQGNVRYDFLNLSVENETLASRAGRYALEEVLDTSAAHILVEATEGSAAYRWEARLALNGTARPPTLRVEAYEPGEGYAEPLERALPFEKLLPPLAREGGAR